MRVYKVCGKCKIEKLADEFGKKKSQSDGLQPWCKKCNTEYLTKWYAENKLDHRKEIRRRVKAYKVNAQQMVIDYLLEHPCIDCGEDDPVVLEFDHRDPSEKTLCVGKFVMLVTGDDLRRLKDEMDKCDVRCANCHRRKTAKERGYTRYKLCVEQQIVSY